LTLSITKSCSSLFSAAFSGGPIEATTVFVFLAVQALFSAAFSGGPIEAWGKDSVVLAHIADFPLLLAAAPLKPSQS